MDKMLSEFITKHKLSDAFQETALQFYVPLASTLLERINRGESPLFVGINGCQGSGKSTMCAFIAEYLANNFNVKVVNLSLDDFYLSKRARKSLAEQIHPLLNTRGVPGTHDIDLLSRTLLALKQGHSGVQTPAFDKAIDDVKYVAQWEYVKDQPDLVLLEGWCWGVMGQDSTALSFAINQLEHTKDEQCVWREYVNNQLMDNYQPLYPLFDYWVMLAAPSFNAVYQWRLEQENKLAATTEETNNHIMSSDQISQFIQYFQRLTEHGLATLPQRVNYLLTLDHNRQVKQVVIGD
ncbi:P-loop NTPase fold protein [Thalassotalea sp. 1_MG-2023]|uniref:P-loop NTPase fold protein n=1 Tax=Thalassotalea sp. 1_MG-2023 TaxID=3062680 RepID=UPI0026E3FEDA|nr:P-loop NTPase fold protein [Thalassotalea sp. 1_MG-2023]MDO6426067.1 P-loop NTPase fold protein [Thalassotalea sp. 1_MG-2023]